MTITTEEFVSSFHSLKGETLGERRKDLFLLLNKIGPNGGGLLDFSVLQPKNILEEKFKVDALVYFKKSPELIEALKYENSIITERILKSSSWLLEQAFKNVKGEQLMVLFASISFITKVKLVNKLAIYLNNPKQADEFFKAIEARYGPYLATKLIGCCSPDLILSYVETKRLKLQDRQVLCIIKKYPDITEQLLTILKKHVNFNNNKVYNKVFAYLVQHDFLLFMKLYKKFKLTSRLGWRVTNKFVKINKDEVIVDPQTSFEFLHKKQIFKTLDSDFKKLFSNLFPPSLLDYEDSTYSLLAIIKILPKRMTDLDLFLNTFKDLYGSEIWDHANCVNVQLLEMLSPEVRQNKIKQEYKPSSLSEDEWMCYWNTDVSLPYLKKRISLSSDIRTRADLVGLLVKTCKLNENRGALGHICRYFITKHRNDHITVRIRFLNAFHREFSLEKLEEQHWTPIREILDLFALNNESYYETSTFEEAYIHYLLLNDLPYKEELNKFLKNNNSSFNIIKSNAKYEKMCLLTFWEVLPELFKEKDLKKRYVDYLIAIMDWNNRHKDDQISIFNYTTAMVALKECLAEETYYNYNSQKLLTYCLHQNIEREEKIDYLKLYLNCHTGYKDATEIDRLIRYEPLIILPLIETIIQFLLHSQRIKNCIFWKQCKNYSYLDIPVKVINICLDMYTRGDKDMVLEGFVTAISYLMPNHQFLEFIKSYYPNTLKADAKNEEGRKLYNLQQNVGNSLKNLMPSSTSLEPLLIFCKGDYLKVIQRSLYSVCDHVNEDKLPAFLAELKDRAVSIRKHAMHLTFRNLDKAHVFDILEKFMKTEKNSSICKFIFKGCFNFFVKNPNDYTWDLVQLSLTSVDITDTEAIDILIRLNKIPDEYFIKYFLFTWDTLGKIPDPYNKMESYKGNLLKSLSEQQIQNLPIQFCETLIKECLFKTNSLSYFPLQIQIFTCKYIIYCKSPEEQCKRLVFVFELLKNYISDKWQVPQYRKSSRNCAGNFVKEFCNHFLNNQNLSKGILVKFAELWNDFLRPHQAIGEYLQFQFTLVVIDKLSLKEICKRIISISESLSNSYGLLVLYTVSNKINNFINYFEQTPSLASDMKRLMLIDNLLDCGNNSTLIYLLVLILLKDKQSNKHDLKTKYDEIIEILKKQDEPIIQLFLNNHFRGIQY